MVECLNMLRAVSNTTASMVPLFDSAAKRFKKEITLYLKSIYAADIKHKKGRFYMDTTFLRKGKNYRISIGDHFLQQELPPYALIEQCGYDGTSRDKIKIPLAEHSEFMAKIKTFTE